MHIVIDGILTQYQIVGEGKKTLLILHGWKRSLNEWVRIVETQDFASLRTQYKIVLLDLPGFGGTPRPQSSYTIYDYANFVEHFLDKLELKNITLLGHSFGGRIGIIVGAKTDIIEKLILVDSAAIEKKSTAIKVRIVLNKLAIIPFKLFLPNKVEKIKSHFGSDDYQTAGNMQDIFIKTVNEDLSSLLKHINVTTIIIWGEKDTIRPIDEAKFIKNHIPHAKLRIVWGAGHSPYLEKPKAFIEILNEVL